MRGDGNSQFPPVQSLASRTVANSTCVVSNGGCEAGGSKSIGRVTELRNLYTRGPLGYFALSGRKPTACNDRKAAVSDTQRRVFATPPGSVITSRACTHRGNSGTWEVQYFSSRSSRYTRGPAQKTSMAREQVLTSTAWESSMKHENNVMQGYSVPSESRGAGDGILEILAEHSTVSESI